MANGRVVVGIDGSPGARSALLWAVDEAHIRGVDLLVVHAVHATTSPMRSGGSDRAAGRPADATSGLLLRTHVVLAAQRQPSVPVRMLLSCAPAAEVLTEQTDSAALLVLGTRGRGGITMSVLGSVSFRVATHAHCPVVVVPEHFASPGDGGPRGRIVLGVSDSPAGRSALEFALQEAAYRGASVHAVRAGLTWEPGRHDDLIDIEVDEPRRRRSQPVNDYPPDSPSRRLYVRVNATATSVDPAEALLHASRDADMIVVGCHHAKDRWSTRLGPVPTAILHRAPCPVVVVGARHPVKSGDQ